MINYYDTLGAQHRVTKRVSQLTVPTVVSNGPNQDEEEKWKKIKTHSFKLKETEKCFHRVMNVDSCLIGLIF